MYTKEKKGGRPRSCAAAQGGGSLTHPRGVGGPSRPQRFGGNPRLRTAEAAVLSPLTNFKTPYVCAAPLSRAFRLARCALSSAAPVMRVQLIDHVVGDVHEGEEGGRSRSCGSPTRLRRPA